MKTRYKIIIVGIVLTTMVFGTHQYLMYQCGTLPVFMETPRNPNLWNCLEMWENRSEQHPKTPNIELIDEFIDLGCTEPAINHVFRYSDLLDDSFDGTYFIEWIGLPVDLSQVEFDKCVKIILEKRIIELYKDTPEVVAFYVEYEDAQVSVREDHISYFSGSQDEYLIRMNLEFDENYEIHNKELHCYFQKIHQTEVPQEDIVTKLGQFDCENEN